MGELIPSPAWRVLDTVLGLYVRLGSGDTDRLSLGVRRVGDILGEVLAGDVVSGAESIVKVIPKAVKMPL